MAFKIKTGRGEELEVQETLVDQLVRWAAPVHGMRRRAARAAMALAGGYTGGSKSKRSLFGKRTTKGATADADLIPDLETMRDRSRDMARNEPLAAGALNTVVTNVVGTGLMLQSQVDAQYLGMTEEEAAQWQRDAEREFSVWCDSPSECDITRTQNFYELQELAFRGTLESGDIFFLTPFKRRQGGAYGLKLQAIEADRVRSQLGASSLTNVVAGVELDEDGAPAKYHIARLKPGVTYATSTEVDEVAAFGARTGRRNVLHLFTRLRPGQTRGVPFLAPVIEPLIQLGRYTEAEISAAVVSAMFAVFVKGAPGGLVPLDSASTGVAPGSSGDAPTSGWDGTLTPGLVAELAPGEDIVSANPLRPNQAFDPFVQAILRQIGVALELPFEVLIKHYTASYSAARAAMLEAWRFYRKKRVWLADKFCQPVYELFLEEAIAAGKISAPGFFDDPRYRMAYAAALWNGDGPGSINPTDDVNAAEKRLQLGLTTLKGETAAYDGSDWEKNTRQRAKEKALRVSSGLEATVQASTSGSTVVADDAAKNRREQADRS